MKFVAGLLLCLTASVMNAAERPVIYQLLPRLFGNTCETRKVNGSLAENGCGKFRDINEAALRSIKPIMESSDIASPATANSDCSRASRPSRKFSPRSWIPWPAK